MGNLKDDRNPTTASSGIQLKIAGLSAGKHSIMAYHNCTDGFKAVVPTLHVAVNGKTVVSGIKQSICATNTSETGQSYIDFDSNGKDTVTILYVSDPEAGVTYPFTGVVINALVFDEANPLTMAANPNPANYNYHVDADSGNYLMSWKAADIAVKHHVYMGTKEDNLTEIAVVADTTYLAKELKNLHTYFWRVDEEDEQGNVHEGPVWTFRPRHIAFPEAEGYGRFSNGGRGGRVVYVTNLNDSGEGSLRWALTNGSGPRTILFMVSGIIDMNFKTLFANDNITVAGQSAPGKGICVAHTDIGLGNDNIWRHMRTRRGKSAASNVLGFRGTDNTIIDLSSLSWGTDETFSGRETKNVTFQKSMIAEPLGIGHGFAASIGGNTGSYHHNLIAHSSGRNWDMMAMIDGNGEYCSHLDIFNNVVYNWWKRTTDGNAHEVNFVANYYKMGPDTRKKILFEIQHQGQAKGTNRAYISGNIRENVDGTLTYDSLGVTYQNDIDKGVKVDYEVFVDKPFFPSYATIHSAKDAFKVVTSDVGANMPIFDDHDKRCTDETINGTWHYKGKPGYKGQIDSEEDCGGYEAYPEQSWPEGFDTDLDGLPDWYESIVGTNPNSPSEDFTDSNSDPDGDGYTLLEDYLELMAHPHLGIKAGASATLNLSQYFRGFTSGPVFSVINNDDNANFSVYDSTLTVKVPTTAKGVVRAMMKVTDSEGSTYERPLYVAITEASITGITSVSKNCQLKTFEAYTLDGKKIASGNAEGHNVNNLPLAKIGNGVFIIKTTDANGNVSTCKIVK